MKKYSQNLREFDFVLLIHMVFKIAKKWALTNKYNAVNVDHKQPIEGCTLFESYLSERCKKPEISILSGEAIAVASNITT